MKLHSEGDISNWIWGMKALSLVASWNALGLFQQLEAGPLAPEELQADPRAIEVSIPVLMHLGLLIGNDQRIALSHRARRLLAAGDLPTERCLERMRDCSRMIDVLRNGGPVLDDMGVPKRTQGGVRTHMPEATEAFQDMLYNLSTESAEQVLSWLGPRLPTGAHLLDVGGGHGRYARAFVDAGFTATVLDLPQIIDYAKGRHGAALNYIAGDFHHLKSFGGPYDLILFSNIAHNESPTANARLIRTAAASLKPGGFVLLKDMFLDVLGRDSDRAAFFGLSVLLYTEEGRSPRLDDARQWLIEAGLQEPQVLVLETHELVLAQRPS